jgi:hypothetical protein
MILVFAAWTPLLAVVGVLTGVSLLMNIAEVTAGLAIGFALVVLVAKSHRVEQSVTILIIDLAASQAAVRLGSGAAPVHKHRTDDMVSQVSFLSTPIRSPGAGSGLTKKQELVFDTATIAGMASTYETSIIHG